MKRLKVRRRFRYDGSRIALAARSASGFFSNRGFLCLRPRSISGTLLRGA